jgi:hypothetical protein
MKHAIRLSALALACSFALMTAQAAPRRDADKVVGTHLAAGSGYVSMVKLAHQSDSQANGSLMMVFEQDGMNGIPLYVSHDNGDSWTFLSNITDKSHAGDKSWQLRWQPNISEVPRDSGDLKPGTLLMAANATGNDGHEHIRSGDLQLYASTDGGKSWSHRGSIIKGGGNPSDMDNKGVWEPDMHILDDGRMVAYYSSEQHKAEGYNQVLAHKISTDGGRHWGSETLDVAIPGGVQRPGMAIVQHLPDGRYAMTYENIDGPLNGQVFIKYSRDGLDWGDPQRHGEPVMTAAGAWPAACPVIRWFPLGGPDGVIVVSAERAGGGGDEGGRSLYWNNALGRGPWWQASAPVQKRTGNIHAGWTQSLILRPDGRLLHATSSSNEQAPDDVSKNEILFASAVVPFDRYEAEDAERQNAVLIDDRKSSNLQKARLGAGTEARLRFPINVATVGTYTVRVHFADLGLPGTPIVVVNGARQSAARVSDGGDGWNVAEVQVPMLAGINNVDLDGAAHAVDVDYLQLNAAPTK